MSATATRSTQAAPYARQAGVALAAVALAGALVIAAAFSQLSASRPGTAPLAGSAPVVHDHGWSTAGTAPATLTIRGTSGGGLTYTGIPYPAPANDQVHGAKGTRLAQ